MKSLLGISLVIVSCLLSGCSKAPSFIDSFNEVHDRVWLGEDYWAVPLEDWQINGGRVECTGKRPNMRVNVLTHQLAGEGSFEIRLKAGLIRQGHSAGSVGLSLGLQDETDNDVRSLCYFGTGVDLGVSTNGKLFLDVNEVMLPDSFNYDYFEMVIEGATHANQTQIHLRVVDDAGCDIKIKSSLDRALKGLVAVSNNHTADSKATDSRFWFDDLHMSGNAFVHNQKDEFGPVLWTMFTLSKGVVKLTAQFPPLGEEDNQQAELWLKENDKWKLADKQFIDPNARTALFTLNNWDATMATDYKVVYQEHRRSGSSIKHSYSGCIQKDPVDRPLNVAGLTCQIHYGFPYTPLVENLGKLNPDLLYFSGDQLYEMNGGYGIVRFPAEKSVLNYLGKWYMFGWAFGDLMKDRPTICTPDDHDVYQGNLWGNSGNEIPVNEWSKIQGSGGGYIQPEEMVNVVHRTQCGHLPDPFDSTPINQGISVYYTDLLYGRVSFAIVSDRMFKSGPKEVATWEGRLDHIKDTITKPELLDKEGLKMLGGRQMEFLKDWMLDWSGADMKVLLSQTVFANVATHHGAEKMLLYGDLDSGGWPRTPRNKLLHLLRQCRAYHICGDQHLPSFVQYGIDDHRDGSWAFCTPAITVGYQRRFHPDRLNWEVIGRPEHNLPNTGDYTDGFGNKMHVYAIGNPLDNTQAVNRYERADNCSSGFGWISFNQMERKIESNAYRFLSDVTAENGHSQFPGWPHTILQEDNDGRQAIGFLPHLKIKGADKPVLQVWNEQTGALEYVCRMKKNSLIPPVYTKGTSYHVVLLDTETGARQEFKSVRTVHLSDNAKLKVEFNH
jgi:hypothetical protein